MHDELHGESIYEPSVLDEVLRCFHDNLHDISKYRIVCEQLDGILLYNYL